MKRIGILLSILLITASIFAYQVRNWTVPTTMANGATNLVTGVTGKRVVLKNTMFTVANACSLYFYSGTAPSGPQISPTFFLGANSGFSSLDGERLDFITKSGEALGVWTSADSGSDIVVEYELIEE